MKKNQKIKGKWWPITIDIQKKISAKYDRKKDFIMDNKGYFLIKVDYKKKLIKVGFCKIKNNKLNKIHKLIIEINGKDAISIINTLIKNKLISSLQHAGDMGIELNKAELSLKYNFKYIQDADLII